MVNVIKQIPRRNMNRLQRKRLNGKQCLRQTWGATLSLFQDFHYRKIMRRSDVLKILFVCVCVCHVCPAHPCGDNPLQLVDSFSRTRGVQTDSMLTIIKSHYPTDYNRLMRDYEMYLQCTQMVNTGYFKRSIADEPRFESVPPSQFPVSDDGKEFMDKTMTNILDSREQQNQGLWENIVDSLSQNNENYSKEQFVNKGSLPPTVKRFLESKSLSPLLKRIFKNYRTDVSYDDFNTL